MLEQYGDTHRYPEYRTIYTVNRGDGSTVLAFQSKDKADRAAKEMVEITKRHFYVMPLRYEVEDV